MRTVPAQGEPAQVHGGIPRAQRRDEHEERQWDCHFIAYDRHAAADASCAIYRLLLAYIVIRFESSATARYKNRAAATECMLRIHELLDRNDRCLDRHSFCQSQEFGDWRVCRLAHVALLVFNFVALTFCACYLAHKLEDAVFVFYAVCYALYALLFCGCSRLTCLTWSASFATISDG